MDGDLKDTLTRFCFCSLSGVLFLVGADSLVALVLQSLDDDGVGDGGKASDDEDVDEEDDVHKFISLCRGSVNQSRCKCLRK